MPVGARRGVPPAPGRTPAPAKRRGSGERLHDLALGVLWSLGAISIVRGGLPGPVRDLAPGWTDGPMTTAALRGILAAAEAWLAVRLLTGGVRADRILSSAALATGAALLVATGLRDGWNLPCGCLQGIAESTVAAGAVRNVLLLGWSVVVLRRGRGDGGPEEPQ